MQYLTKPYNSLPLENIQFLLYYLPSYTFFNLYCWSQKKFVTKEYRIFRKIIFLNKLALFYILNPSFFFSFHSSFQISSTFLFKDMIKDVSFFRQRMKFFFLSLIKFCEFPKIFHCILKNLPWDLKLLVLLCIFK